MLTAYNVPQINETTKSEFHHCDIWRDHDKYLRKKLGADIHNVVPDSEPQAFSDKKMKRKRSSGDGENGKTTSQVAQP
jgi:hypothetical protein